MAVGALPSEKAAQASKPSIGFHNRAVSAPSQRLPLTKASPAHRSLFWEVIPLCDLYSIVHVVALPILQRPYAPAANGTQITSPSAKPSPFVEALQNIGLGAANWSQSAGVSIFTIILPSTDGYISRSDFLQLRLQDFPYAILKTHEPLPPLSRYSAIHPSPSKVNSEDVLAGLVHQAAGVVQWSDLDTSVSISELQDCLVRLTQELRDRLNNAPWLSPTPIPRRRVALVRGRPNITAGGPVYRAAKALGLDLVIIDDEGHWLQADTEANRMHREAFLATDMTEDAGVVDRIVQSIIDYPLPIHGVFTLSDNFFVAVAKVADVLGLPAPPVSAFETSVDKYRSRLLQNVPGQTARVASVKELESLLTSTGRDQVAPAFVPRFPMIVKPTKGWSSECVSKVNNLEDLATAVRKATARHGSAAVIEPFFDGPEIDVNFILLEGEILFSEIADEPPCDGDSSSATVNDTFSPEALTLPSALPASEQAIAKSTLRDILVNMGFRTGVFHVEARMINSATEYRDVGDGLVDLVGKQQNHQHSSIPSPECKLIEINARPPGYRVTVPSRHTYGVDYFAAHMLAAAGDHGRLRMVASPFDHQVDGRTPGAQYWSRLVYVPAPAVGVVRWPLKLSPCEELRRRRPDLAGNIVLGVDYCIPGDKIDLYTDGARTYVAHLLVSSRESRLHAIKLEEEVLRAFSISVEGQGKMVEDVRGSTEIECVKI
ncbi:hypothetical protein QBC42DRAFT_349460 [Cladorrhinum samala]|uniref:ATP-grasp domain-containing protein n=1 Tax=Cladorrhinum samala TaxID=585594 RepID=A0AAV9HCY3_9PEZI|nr:hypothetical protein QBC42DRAFT_349460 [Cladorrhinum samala]